MNLNSIRFILVETSHPGNIGSSARALKTMGFNRLYLVNPLSFPDQKATELAAGADDVLHHCQVTATLEEALRGCRLVIATSARPRHLALPGLTPKTCADLVSRQADDTEIAIIFGRERTGLTNEELMHSHFHVVIASNPDYSSLNLSQAVQILAYELRDKYLTLTAPVTVETVTNLAKLEEVERFYTHLEEVLKKINFLKPSNQMVLMRLRRLFNRTGLEEVEVKVLRGILTQIEHSTK